MSLCLISLYVLGCFIGVCAGADDELASGFPFAVFVSLANVLIAMPPGPLRPPLLLDLSSTLLLVDASVLLSVFDVMDATPEARLCGSSTPSAY